jgi:hypothetical protein
MNTILNLLRKPATTAEQLRAKLAQLQQADPLAVVPTLREERTKALMSGDDKTVTRLDAELLAVERDAERKTLALADIAKQIERAEAAEIEAERAKARKKGEAATKKMPAALADLERVFDLAREKLDVINALNVEVEEINATLPEADRLPLPELVYRGYQPSEPRTERSRRTVFEFWMFAENGQEVPAKLVEHIKQTGPATGTVEVRDPTIRSYGLHEISEEHRDAIGPSAEAWYPRRDAVVVKRRRVAVVHDEARPAHVFPLLAHEVYLPASVMVADTRRPREQVTQVVIENVAADEMTDESEVA